MKAPLGFAMAVVSPKHTFLLTISETADVLGIEVEEGLLAITVVDRQLKYPWNKLDVGGGVA